MPTSRAPTHYPAATAPQTPLQRLAQLAFILSAVAWLASPFQAQAQESWRGLTIPAYANATDVSTSIDEDEYELYFQSEDDAQAIFDFYRQNLEQQGFKVTKTKTRKRGFKADLARGQGGPDDQIELDVKKKHGRYKVEIEFDD